MWENVDLSGKLLGIVLSVIRSRFFWKIWNIAPAGSVILSYNKLYKWSYIYVGNQYPRRGRYYIHLAEKLMNKVMNNFHI